MREFVVLRFRDLVTEPGGTISEHQRILEQRGFVWWGWWMRQYEEPPRELLRGLYEQLEAGVEPEGYLFDSGQELLWGCSIADMRVAPPGESIGPPELDAAPAYYQRGMYPAWFKLAAISGHAESTVPEQWTYASFPTNPGGNAHPRLVGRPVESLEELRLTDATLWVVAVP